MKLKFPHLVTVAALLGAGSLSAHAQLGVYGTISAERLSGVQCQSVLGGPSSTQPSQPACSYNDGVDRAVGGGGGVYYDWLRKGPAVLGLDIRADILKSNKSASFDASGNNAFRMDGILSGARARFSVDKNFLSPYAEALFGWNRRDRTDNFFAYRVVGGLDVNLLPVMSVRIPEVSVGQDIGMGGVKSNTVESVSVGVVFHLPNGR